MQQSINTRRTQNNDADTSAAPGDDSAGVGELRSDGVEHSHGCGGELAAAVNTTQGCERGHLAAQSSKRTEVKKGSMNQPVSMLPCLLKN
jgi:hypothetical protein